MNSKDLLQLYNGQLQEFELAKKNYTDLQQAVYRDIPFDLFRLRIQYNPARMISTNARIDVRTLQNRKCFLCREHMPEAQKGIRYNDRYSIFIESHLACEYTIRILSVQNPFVWIQFEGESISRINISYSIT